MNPDLNSLNNNRTDDNDNVHCHNNEEAIKCVDPLPNYHLRSIEPNQPR